ncbi:Ribonuclease h-like superfamily protein [Thalictrum thalictroides]|uniref:Ribonuclease h-like superfamily protein n=1 Tax=Thalictrum thalictroides TaxID=46969 RepID=A0A7J6WYM0_THATH|nr:Ribonuclease h-like superfamily protein [Thalictrum thalictroides]
MVSQLILPNSNLWNETLLRSIFTHDIVHHIKNTAIARNTQIDNLKWMHTKNGNHSVKSMYNYLSNGSITPIVEKYHLKLWKAKAPPRVILFSWKCLTDCVPTREKIAKHVMIPTRLSPICNLQVESLKHMLLDCSFTQKFWFACLLNFRIIHFKNLIITQWIKIWFTPPANWIIETSLWTSSCVNITWLIWKSRCRKIFQNKTADPLHIGKTTDLVVKQYHNITCTAATQIHDQPTSIWLPPPPSFYKINVDITFRSSQEICGIGFILRDSMGKFITAGTRNTCAETAEAAEYNGMLAAVRRCHEHRVRKIQLETDNAAAAEFLRGK